MGGDGGGGQGGFGGLGIGNPGSYGGQQSTTAPGFDGGYGTSSTWGNIKSKIPGVAGGILTGFLTGNALLGLGATKMINAGMDSDFVKNLQVQINSGKISLQDAEVTAQAHAKQKGIDPVTFQAPPTEDEVIKQYIKSVTPGIVLGPDQNDAERAVKDWIHKSRDRAYGEDPIVQNLASQIETLTNPTSYNGGTSVTTDFTKDPTINPAPPDPTTAGEDNMATPFTITMDDLVKDPRFAMYKNASQEQYGLARDNIMEKMPQGGQLVDMLAGLETDKAKYMTNAFGNMGQDIIDKQYGTDLAKMGANVSLSGQATQRDIAEDAQMNQMMTMIGYGLASK